MTILSGEYAPTVSPKIRLIDEMNPSNWQYGIRKKVDIIDAKSIYVFTYLCRNYERLMVDTMS